MQIHCLTTADDLTAVCLVNTNYNKTFGKKFLSNVSLEFRESFSFNPSMYLDLTEDMADWDEGLHFDTLDDIWTQWQDPEKSDQLYQMEAQLHQIKDIFLDNLEQVMKRGEKIEELHKKTEGIKIQTNQIKKKAKKLNRGMCFGICGGSQSRGPISKPGAVTTAKATYQAGKAAGSIKDSL